MRVWLLTVGEPLPIDEDDPRLYRTGILSDALTRAGHEVVWWTSTFDHVRKRHRFTHDTNVRMQNGSELRLLRGCGYRRNVSLARIIDHRQLATAFRRHASKAPRPDVILCSMPTIGLSVAATEYGSRHGVPVVLDIRDLWPDLIVDHAPRWARFPARIVLDSMYRDLRRACRSATAIISITDSMVQWGLEYAKRDAHELDRSFPLAYPSSKPPEAELDKARQFWRSHGVGLSPDEFVVCFIGSLSERMLLDDVVNAAKLLQQSNPACRIVMCGEGEDRARCEARALGLSNIVFPGWVGKAEIWSLLRLAKVGLVPYPSTFDFVRNITNKVAEYFSAGLPVLTSLDGALRQLLETEDCGLHYAGGKARALADLIDSLARDPVRRTALSHNASSLYRRRFVAEKVYSQMCGYLEQLAISAGDQRLRAAA